MKCFSCMHSFDLLISEAFADRVVIIRCKTGMHTIGVAGHSSMKELQLAGADRVLAELKDLQAQDIRDLSSQPPASDMPPNPTPVQQAGFLDVPVQLPGGYRTSRRELLKLTSLGTGTACIYVAATRAKIGIAAYVARAWPYWRKAFSFGSPKALLRALLPQSSPVDRAGDAAQHSERVVAFKRYLAEVEAKGGGEAVPDFPAGAAWFNAPPLKLSRELRGRVLLLDFWTYCCINCMHILPDLAALEAKYASQPVTVVGVHSAKFDNEKDDDAIRNAVLRYEIGHPCVNDANMILWRDLGIASWPTLALVSPRGRLLTLLPGEGQKDNVDAFLAAALELYGERGELDYSSSVPLALERAKDSRLAQSPLRFPGKLACHVASDRLFIADSNNHRIVISDLKGGFLSQIGGNGPNLIDGPFSDAAFNRPQGLAYSAARDMLYVADTENHALREVSLARRQVRTLAGNGQQGRDYQGGGSGRGQQLSSPWDVVLDQQEAAVFIALAGQHQIWRHDIASGTTAALSGDGSERNANGSTGVKTSWAQPSGLALSLDGKQLWVADSESSTIRSMALLSGAGKAHVGGDAMFSDNLFKFGDRDGSGTDALLQHPLAVAALPNGRLLVADSYNHKLKVLDPQSNTIRSWLGTGRPGFKDGSRAEAQLSEPGGLAPGPDNTIFVADTNNSLIRVVHYDHGIISTLQLTDIPPPRVGASAEPAAAAFGSVPPRGATALHVPTVKASNGALLLELQLPAGYHYTQGANSRFEVHPVQAAQQQLQLEPASGSLSESGAIAIRFNCRQAARGRLLAKVYFCQDKDMCLFQELSFELAFQPDLGNLTETVKLQHSVQLS